VAGTVGNGASRRTGAAETGEPSERRTPDPQTCWRPSDYDALKWLAVPWFSVRDPAGRL